MSLKVTLVEIITEEVKVEAEVFTNINAFYKWLTDDLEYNSDELSEIKYGHENGNNICVCANDRVESFNIYNNYLVMGE